MISATEARKRAANWHATRNKLDEALNNADKVVREHAEDGNYRCSIRVHLTVFDLMVRELEGLGYDVKTDGETINIAWNVW